MKVEWVLQAEYEEPKVVIYAKEKTDALLALEGQLSGLNLSPIPATTEGKTILLAPDQVLRFYTDGKAVCAQTAQQTCSIRLRLYELEERLDPHTFVRISNSEILNLNKITAMDLSLTGTIRITLEDGTATYVSRRYVKKIKEALGLGRRNTP